MSVLAAPESGPGLDRRIARLVGGSRSIGDPLAYSTDEGAADSLTALLERRGIAATLEQDADHWYCVFWSRRSGDAVMERIASGTALTRPLAICRATMNLPLVGSGNRLRLRRTTRGWIGPEDPAPRAIEPDAGRSTRCEEDRLERPRAAAQER
jgi:hypothetical protein